MTYSVTTTGMGAESFRDLFVIGSVTATSSVCSRSDRIGGTSFYGWSRSCVVRRADSETGVSGVSCV